MVLTYTGILTLHLDKESYERAGLVGKPDGVKGGRGTKPWWGKMSSVKYSHNILTQICTVIEINLRLPSMLHGRKAFERILYAFKNVLTKPVTWLFHDLNSTGKHPLALNDYHIRLNSASPRT